MVGALTGALIAFACVVAFVEGRDKGRTEVKPPVAEKLKGYEDEG